MKGAANMRYYLKKCGFQELGSVKNGKAQRGRYLLTSMSKEVLGMFPPLSEAQLNDSALLPVIPLYSGKKFIVTMFIIMINFMVLQQLTQETNTESTLIRNLKNNSFCSQRTILS